MEISHEATIQEVTLVAGSGSQLAGEGDFAAMLTVALDGIIELSGAERGLVLLFDEEGRLLIEKGRIHGRRDLDSTDMSICGDVLARVRNRQSLPFRLDASRPDLRQDAQCLKHLLVASMPIHHAGRLCGLVYLDHSGATLSRETLHLAQSLAQLASVAACRGGEHWRWRCVDATRWNIN